MIGNNEKSQNSCLVRGAVWGELVSGKTFPDLRDFSGNIAFWAPELLLILLGNEGFRASGTQIRLMKNREFISP